MTVSDTTLAGSIKLHAFAASALLRENTGQGIILQLRGPKSLVGYHGELSFSSIKNTHLRSVSQQANLPLVRTWLEFCAGNHSTTCCPITKKRILGLRLIDCLRRMFSEPPEAEQGSGFEYVALSYCWGKAATSVQATLPVAGKELPINLPPLIEDAMAVT